MQNNYGSSWLKIRKTIPFSRWRSSGAAILTSRWSAVETLPDFGAAVTAQVWDVILCDHCLPGFTSFHVLDQLKQRQYDIPFIILSAVIGEDVAVQAMKSGANDYEMKGAIGRLVPSIEREVARGGQPEGRTPGREGPAPQPI